MKVYLKNGKKIRIDQVEANLIYKFLETIDSSDGQFIFIYYDRIDKIKIILNKNDISCIK